jgi:hypothetical protein
MKKRIYFVVFAMCCSCDPSENLETEIINSSNSNLEISFISRLILENEENNKETLKIKSDNSITYKKINVSNNGLGRAGLSLIDFDSIYLSNENNEILNVWKPDTPGKNIYNIDKYWTVRETSKNHFVYTYEITNEDLIIEKRKKSIK